VPFRGPQNGRHLRASVRVIIRVVKDKGPGINRELVEQFEQELVEAWQQLEEAHMGLRDSPGDRGVCRDEAAC